MLLVLHQARQVIYANRVTNMCTLSIFRQPHKLIVTMNRDESRQRAEAGINQWQGEHTQALFPIDGLAGGTWFGINNTGVVMALLNRYQDPQVKNAPTRGQIIPSSLEQGSCANIINYLNRCDFTGFNPFDLFLITLNSEHHFSWNGQKITITQHCKEAMQFSSSGFDTALVLKKRQIRFEQQLKQHPQKAWQAKQILSQLHLHQDPLEPSNSVLMDRPHTHTKSTCQVILQESQNQFNYYPEASLAQWREGTVPVSHLLHQHHNLKITP